MKPSILFSTLTLLLSMIQHTHADLPPRWRTPEGALTPAPAEAEAAPGTVLASAGTEGEPVFLAPQALNADEVVSVTFDLEIVQSEADDGAAGQAGIILSAFSAHTESTQNHHATQRWILILGQQTETFHLAFRTQQAYDAEELMLHLSPAYFGRTVRLSNLSVQNHGSDTTVAEHSAPAVSYAGHAPDAAWRTEAARKIDAHRKADLHLVITDRLGQPVPNAEIHIQQLRHDYPFGTAVIGWRLADAPIVLDPEQFPDSEAAMAQFTADNARYREELKKNFNTIVFENELKWPQWAGSRPSRFRQSWSLDALRWLRTHAFDIKGHTVVWGSWQVTPAWLKDLEAEPESVQAAVLTHIRDVSNATSDFTRWWDVLNEPMSHRSVIELVGMENVAEWFKTAREFLPDTRLVMNEFDIVGNGGSPTRRQNFIAFAQELEEHGAPIDVIGFQAHFWSSRLTPPETIWEIIDEVHQATGRPLMVSEFDMNLPNETLQADYTRDFLTAWFAHPATEAFIMWGFWGGAHWMGDTGAMFRSDWTPKPNLTAWRDLVYGEWWTQETVRTDARGRVSLRAFQGTHEIRLSNPYRDDLVREIHLPAEGRTLHMVSPAAPEAR